MWNWYPTLEQVSKQERSISGLYAAQVVGPMSACTHMLRNNLITGQPASYQDYEGLPVAGMSLGDSQVKLLLSINTRKAENRAETLENLIKRRDLCG